MSKVKRLRDGVAIVLMAEHKGTDNVRLVLGFRSSGRNKQTVSLLGKDPHSIGAVELWSCGAVELWSCGAVVKLTPTPVLSIWTQYSPDPWTDGSFHQALKVVMMMWSMSFFCPTAHFKASC
ncbi:hypothetical protein EYF80_003642 [Liparis tanakae]|uniref:Uncharacterized protein n=1 Tax=Liparis tanakae TaxID=230148 RepID=A0A4Z2J7B0_9TELE|nr:hypothetical protein EYF80_003642 [Liparis tanakae]